MRIDNGARNSSSENSFRSDQKEKDPEAAFLANYNGQGANQPVYDNNMPQTNYYPPEGVPLTVAPDRAERPGTFHFNAPGGQLVDQN